MGIKDFVNGVLGIDDEYEDEVITEKEIEEEKKKISASSAKELRWTKWNRLLPETVIRWIIPTRASHRSFPEDR